MLVVYGNVNPKIVFLGQIAQLVEHPPEKWKVSGSIPLLATFSPSECLHKHAGGFCAFVTHSPCKLVSGLCDKSGDMGIYDKKGLNDKGVSGVVTPCRGVGILCHFYK